jgi:hypothetical protein
MTWQPDIVKLVRPMLLQPANLSAVLDTTAPPDIGLPGTVINDGQGRSQ